MLFKSKMIYDPHQKRPNLMGLTVGLTFHTPKFWDCQNYDFYTSQFDTMRGPDGLDDEEMERRYQTKLAHANCKRKHLSYPGYMYWTGPKRRYEFRYMGPTHPRDRWWKPFSIVSGRATYVRFLDNGPKPPERRSPLEGMPSKTREGLKTVDTRFRDAMARSRQQMADYEKRRKNEDSQ